MSKKNKIIQAKLIANPGSGTSSDRGKLLEQVTLCLKEHGIEVDVAVAKPKERAIPIARKAVQDGYKLIIGMGGDDTIEAIIRGMAGSKARLAMIPVGTANNLAKSLGIPESVDQACALIADGNMRKLDMGQVKMKNGTKLPFFELVMVGIGSALYPDALHASKGKKLIPSLQGAIRTVLTHETKPKITIEMDGESSVRVETMLAVVSNVPLIGPNMLMYPDASMEDGLLDISLYPNFSKAELLAYTARTMDDTPPDDGKIQRYRAQTIKIKTSPKLDVMADGVMLGKGKVKIKVLPGALRVIAPEVGAGVEKPPEEIGADLPAPVAPVVDNNKEKEPEKIADA
jgi:diacylglycerol kinase (ATP)